MPDKVPFIYVFFETAVYCLDNLSPFVTKLYVYLLWSFNYYQEKIKNNGFEFFDDPYCVSLTKLGKVLGYSNSKNTNRKVLTALETLRRVGLIDFDNEYYYKTLDNGQVTHFYKINQVYARSLVQDSIVEWALKDPEIIGAEDEEEVLFQEIDQTFEELNNRTCGINEYNSPYYKDAVTIFKQFKNYFDKKPVKLDVTDSMREASIAIFGKDYCDALVNSNMFLE